MNVGQAVQGDVPGEKLEDEPLRFEGPYLSRVSGELRQMYRVRADIRPCLHDDMTGFYELVEQGGFPLAVFAVQAQRFSDVLVELVVHDFSIAKIMAKIEVPHKAFLRYRHGFLYDIGAEKVCQFWEEEFDAARRICYPVKKQANGDEI